MSIIPLDELGKCSSADVQVGCEAAIDAKSASFITWAQTGAAAAILAASLPDGAGVEAACVAAITSETAGLVAAIDVAVSASVDAALDPPNTGPYATGALVGSFFYNILVAVPGSSAGLYGFVVTSDTNCVLQIMMSGGTMLGDAHNVIAGVPAQIAVSLNTTLGFAFTVNVAVAVSLQEFASTT